MSRISFTRFFHFNIQSCHLGIDIVDNLLDKFNT